jgi:hypothetical protein
MILQGGISKNDSNPPVTSSTAQETTNYSDNYEGSGDSGFSGSETLSGSVGEAAGALSKRGSGSKLLQGRAINWSRSYLWDVKIPSAPAPFKNYFPAIEVEDGLAISNSFQYEMGHTTLRIPQNTTNFDMRITFIDDEHGTLEKWMTKWIEEIFVSNPIKGSYVNYLDNIVKWMYVTKLNSYHESIQTTSYLVYPEGSIYGVNNSDANVRMFNCTFVVVRALRNI